MADTELLKNAGDFETQFNSWFNSAMKPLIDDSRARYRMYLSDKAEREERGLSALPSTKSVEVVDKAKESALVEYHKDLKAITYTSKSIDIPEANQLAAWLTALVHYRMDSIDGFPFFSWHDNSLKAGFTDGIEAAMVRWKKESYKESNTLYFDHINNLEIDERQYKEIKAAWDESIAPMPFESAFTKETVTEEVVCKDTWWIDSLVPGENVLWDFKAPLFDVNQGQKCLVKIRLTVDEIMSYMDKGIFDKKKREEIENYRSIDSTTQTSDPTAIAPATKTVDMGDDNRVELWIFWEKVSFRWMVSFSLEGKLLLTKDRKPSDDIFFNGRRVNVLPVRIGYTDKALHENIGRSLPQVIAPIEDQYIDHINNVNDISKNMARGGRIRLSPGHDVDIDQVLNGGVFQAEQGEVEFIQYNPGVMEGLRAADMTSAAINSLAPVGVSPVNIAPKGTNKTLGVSQMIQGATDAKRYCQLMVRNQTFFKPLLWLIAQMEFAYETDQVALTIAAGQVPGFKPPITVGPDGQPMIDVGVLDFNVDVQINAGLGEMPDVEKFQNLMQFKAFCDQIGIKLDPTILGQLGASLAGYAFDRFNPQLPQSPEPKPKLDSKLTVSAGWIDLPVEVQMMLVEKWRTGQVATDTKIDAQLNEMMHNGGAQPQQHPDMTQGPEAAAMSEGGQIGGSASGS